MSEIGGMNHYLLPSWKGGGIPTAKFGNIAIGKLMERIAGSGSERKKSGGKVFGGASQIGEMGIFSIGRRRNVELAFHLRSEMISPVVASQVGGECGRIVLFNTNTGSALVKLVEPKVMKESIHVH